MAQLAGLPKMTLLTSYQLAISVLFQAGPFPGRGGGRPRPRWEGLVIIRTKVNSARLDLPTGTEKIKMDISIDMDKYRFNCSKVSKIYIAKKCGK